jgi:folate-binding protein YgfZ
MSDSHRVTPETGVVADRTSLVWVGGPDAVSFLEGLLSQGIGAMRPGAGARSLLLAPNGKLRALLWVLRDEDRIGLLCDAGILDTVLGDLRRFKIRVNVEITVETERVWEVWGPAAATLTGHDGSDVLRVGESGLVAPYPLQRSPLPRFVVIGAKPRAPIMSPAMVEMVRIEHGEAVGGIDLDDKVIPQEAIDTAAAVDFTKGCYLGQELVARIDSRGHVNRRLIGFVFAGGAQPPAGSDIVHEDRVVGRLTSVTPSEQLGGTIGLGMLRTEVGAEAAITAGEICGRVCELPIRR